jgi:2-polyprenyl-3-methyl-5-hydroxy-6-metoxy-1,4-benzoquinol methylase
MVDQKKVDEKAAKKCERCGDKIPDDYVNLLCDKCYKKMAEDKEKKEEENPTKPVVKKIEKHVNGITEPNYMENPEAEDKEQWEENIKVFRRSGKMLWGATRQMYEFIKNYNLEKIQHHPQYPKFIWKPKIVDVGCGCGVGSNILSQEADFVWGIDKNEGSIKFAKECFTRIKNHIYYSAQITFDVIDIMDDTREKMMFDSVVAIEIIEHIKDYKKFLEEIKKFQKKDKRGNLVETEYWISTPNRNNKKLSNHKPRNKYHTREWTSGEFYNVLSDYFGNIRFYNSAGEPIPFKEYDTTTHTPLLAKATL